MTGKGDARLLEARLTASAVQVHHRRARSRSLRRDHLGRERWQLIINQHAYATTYCWNAPLALLRAHLRDDEAPLDHSAEGRVDAAAEPPHSRGPARGAGVDTSGDGAALKRRNRNLMVFVPLLGRPVHRLCRPRTRVSLAIVPELAPCFAT